MTAPTGRPDWLTDGVVLVIALVLVGAFVGGAVALTTGAHAPAVVATDTSAPTQLPTSVPSVASSPTAASSLRATIDRSLLAVLPASVSGLAVTEYPDAENSAITDADLGRNVDRLATAFVGDAAGTNWAYTSVVDVRPDARTDAFYRDWQESFDQSACDQAGGVTGHTTITIASRTVERTACGGGVRTYHVRMPDSGLLISISDVGPANFAEQELNALRP